MLRKLLLLLLINGSALALYGQKRFSYDFETANTLPKFTEFGTDYELYENPEANDVNPSLLVGKVFKIPGKSMSWSGLMIKNLEKVNLRNGGVLKMKVYATTEKGKVQVNFQDDSNQLKAYSSSHISKLNEWQELTFRFKKNIDHNFNRLMITFDVGHVEPHIYYFDDIEWISGKSQSHRSVNE